MLQFEELISELERTGHRRLVVLSGEAQWTLTQALTLRDALPGDWVRLDEHPSKAISGLLGREFRHAVFDASAGFDVAAFAAIINHFNRHAVFGGMAWVKRLHFG